MNDTFEKEKKEKKRLRETVLIPEKKKRNTLENGSKKRFFSPGLNPQPLQFALAEIF